MDGDGRADQLFFDPATATWAITYADGRRETRRFGAPGDVSAPGDHDGDGIADLAVYRPGTSEAFLLDSRDGALHLAIGDLGAELGPRTRLLGPSWLWYDEVGRGAIAGR